MLATPNVLAIVNGKIRFLGFAFVVGAALALAFPTPGRAFGGQCGSAIQPYHEGGAAQLPSSGVASATITAAHDFSLSMGPGSYDHTHGTFAVDNGFNSPQSSQWIEGGVGLYQDRGFADPLYPTLWSFWTPDGGSTQYWRPEGTAKYNTAYTFRIQEFGVNSDSFLLYINGQLSHLSTELGPLSVPGANRATAYGEDWSFDTVNNGFDNCDAHDIGFSALDPPMTSAWVDHVGGPWEICFGNGGTTGEGKLVWTPSHFPGACQGGGLPSSPIWFPFTPPAS